MHSEYGAALRSVPNSDMHTTSRQSNADSIAVLGIDAAWTAHNPSGVSLWRRDQGRWACVRVSPSYAAFCGVESSRFDDRADVPAILATCRKLLGNCPLRAVAVDMPIANSPITGRRAADNAASREFGARHCSTHSPSPTRPGEVSSALTKAFGEKGYPVACDESAKAPALVEVYPHVSLLAIARYGEPNGRRYAENYRLPYKAATTRKYWPTITDANERRQRLIAVWNDILSRLAQFADISVFSLPNDIEERSFEALKPYEDQIDALVCAWTAARFVERALVPMGDDRSAIWVPKELIELITAIPS